LDLVKQTYNKEEATAESERCLFCDMRLKISAVPFPPKRQSTKGR
jgi:hypothetical protein